MASLSSPTTSSPSQSVALKPFVHVTRMPYTYMDITENGHGLKRMLEYHCLVRAHKNSTFRLMKQLLKKLL